jgi:hypothetical protein
MPTGVQSAHRCLIPLSALSSHPFLLFADNCALESVRRDCLSRIIHNVGHKKRVSAQVCYLHVLPNQQLGPGDELLASYGGKKFWSRLLQSAEYCITCFSRACDDPDDPLVQCSGADEGRPCLVSRHRQCFPAPWPTMTELSALSDVHFLCPKHLHIGPSAAAVRLHDSPKFAPPIFATAIQFTPPHSLARSQQPTPMHGSSTSAPAAAASTSSSVRRNLDRALNESTSQAAIIAQPCSSPSLAVSQPIDPQELDEVDMTGDDAWMDGGHVEAAESEDDEFDVDQHELSDAACSSGSSSCSSGCLSDSTSSADERHATVRHGAQSRRNQADPPCSMEGTASRVTPLQLRKVHHVRQLSEATEHSTPLNSAQKLKVMELLMAQCRSKTKPWLIPQWMYDHAQKLNSASAVLAAPSSSRASVASSSSTSTAPQFSDEEVDAFFAATQASRTTNR